MTLAIVLFAGTMGLVALFIESKMPELLADLIMEKVPNVQMAAVRSGLLFVGAVFSAAAAPKNQVEIHCKADIMKEKMERKHFFHEI